MAELQIKVSSIMFTDVVGYSRMIARDEAHALDLLEEHNIIIRQAIEKYDGKIIKFIGDSVFSEFDSSNNCAQSAIHIQNAFKKRNELSRKEDRVLIRIGLHCGNVVVKDDDLFGNDVNLGSRIEGIAPLGGIAGSQNFCDTLDIDQSIHLREMGHIKLKNIKTPQCIYRIYLDKYDHNQETSAELRKSQEERGINFIDINSYKEIETISVALLYLKNIGKDADEYFCYEFTESLTEHLKKINNIRIPSFSDSTKFKDTDQPITEIARQLVVDNIIEGHILKSNDKLIVSLKIIDTNTSSILIDNEWKGSINSIKRIQFQILNDILQVFDLVAPQYLQKYFKESVNKDSEAYQFYVEAKYLYDTISHENDLTKARDLFKKAIALDSEYVDALAQLAMTYHRLGQNEKAEQILEDALCIAETNNDEYGLSIILNCLGAIYMDWTKYEKAFNHYKKALIIQVELEDRFTEAKILNNLGGCYQYLGENDKALKCLQNSIKIKNDLEEYQAVGISYAQMGNVYYEIGNYSLAIDTYKESLGKFRASNMRYNEGRVVSLIAEMYLEIGYYNDMKRYLQEAKEIISDFEIPFTSGKLCLLNARYFYEMKNYENSIDYYKQSIDYFQMAEQRHFNYAATIELSIVYFALENRDKAYSALKKAEKIGKKMSEYENDVFLTILFKFINGDTVDEDGEKLTQLYNILEKNDMKNSYKSWWYLGSIYQSMKNDNKSQDCFQKAQLLLEETAQKIENAEHRKSFLNTITINQSIRSAV